MIITGRNEVVAKVIFLHLFVILFTGGMHAGIPPPPDQAPPIPGTHREADSGIRSMSGRYASYWNAFLFTRICILSQKVRAKNYFVHSQSSVATKTQLYVSVVADAR